MKATRVQPPVITPPATIQVEMSEEEARMLFAILGKISGPSNDANDPRSTTSNLYHELEKALKYPDPFEPPVFFREVSDTNVWIAGSRAGLKRR